MTLKERILLKLIDWLAGKPRPELLTGSQNEANRDEWIIQKLQKIPAKTRILDVGAGELPYKKYCTHLNYVAQDFGKFMPNTVAIQPDKWKYGNLDIISDITQIPSEDASFEVILCTEVLEHLPQPIDAIREFSRLLCPKGILLLTAPFSSNVHFAPYHFASGFSRFFYETHLPEYQLQIKELTPNGNLFEHLAQELEQSRVFAEKYTDMPFSIFERRSTAVVLQRLAQLAQQDTGSFEVNCFGWFVEAQKTI